MARRQRQMCIRDSLNTEGEVLGLGLCAYSSDEARSIIGHQTSEIEKILGYAGRGVIVHRDNIAF